MCPKFPSSWALGELLWLTMMRPTGEEEDDLRERKKCNSPSEVPTSPPESAPLPNPAACWASSPACSGWNSPCHPGPASDTHGCDLKRRRTTDRVRNTKGKTKGENSDTRKTISHDPEPFVYLINSLERLVVFPKTVVEHTELQEGGAVIIAKPRRRCKILDGFLRVTHPNVTLCTELPWLGIPGRDLKRHCNL